MTGDPALRAFAGYGIELEYMIVHRDTLAVMPIADELLQAEAGKNTANVDRGDFGWSNELALHLVEVKNGAPAPSLAGLGAGFQAELARIDTLLADRGARLMPTAMHPWMDPFTETRLWPHEDAHIYRAYDRIFDCRAHGWANIQSMHVNLPFGDDDEFSRLHAAVRVLLPILPALAASSPVAEGRPRGALDFRMACYRLHPARVPSLIDDVIPDGTSSRADYEALVLAPMYRDIAPFDPEGILRREWLNARGAIPRFDRSAVEIRVIDMQECPRADLAIAALASAVVRALFMKRLSPQEDQQQISTAALARVLLACIADADLAVIDDATLLTLFNFPGIRCTARELWQHLFETCQDDPLLASIDRAPLELILAHGTLARRILCALGPDFSQSRLHGVYRELCDCVAHDRLFPAAL